MRRLLTALTASLLVVALLPVTAIAGVPTPDDRVVSTDEDTALAIVLTATEDTGSAVAQFTPSGADHGGVTPSADIECDDQAPNHCWQEFTYTPDHDFNGSDGFTYTATSDGSPSASATVSITVDPVNDGPAADPQSVTVAEDSPGLAIMLADPEDDPLTFDVVTQPAHGTLSGTEQISPTSRRRTLMAPIRSPTPRVMGRGRRRRRRSRSR